MHRLRPALFHSARPTDSRTIRLAIGERTQWQPATHHPTQSIAPPAPLGGRPVGSVCLVFCSSLLPLTRETRVKENRRPSGADHRRARDEFRAVPPHSEPSGRRKDTDAQTDRSCSSAVEPAAYHGRVDGATPSTSTNQALPQRLFCQADRERACRRIAYCCLFCCSLARLQTRTAARHA